MIDRIGFIGGGQLGRMLAVPAIELGYGVAVVDHVENCPAKQVGAEQIRGELTDTLAIWALQKQTDVLTWEIEHIPAEYLSDMQAQYGWEIEPSPVTLMMIQDKLTQKTFLQNAGIPVAPFSENLDEADFLGGGPYVVKLRKGGYDGRGNMVVDRPEDFYETLKNDADAKRVFEGKPVYMEQAVAFEKELAVIAARDKPGNIVAYPVVETIHEDNICNMVISPAEISLDAQQQAREIAQETMSKLSGAGVFAIEMFLVNGQVMVNEIAPRVHNSGHLTIEAHDTSQFEQHIRAITGASLGSTSMKFGAAVMINTLGRGGEERPLNREGLNRVLALPNTHPHFYGKDVRPKRKVGHIVLTGSSVRELTQTAHEARDMLVKI